MKKVICLILTGLMLFVFCGCKDDGIKNSNTSSATFGQSMTISEMSIPVKFKSTEKSSYINEMFEILEQINKTETIKEDIGTFKYVIKVTIDSNSVTYMIGENIFKDASGIRYKIKNADETIEKITEIFDEIDTEEPSDT